MTIQELIYDSPEGVTFVMMVNSDEYEKYKKGEGPAIAEVVNSFPIFKYDQGHTGNQSTPSNRELKDVFGSTNDMAIAEMMLKEGKLHTAGKKNKGSDEPETDPRGHMM